MSLAVNMLICIIWFLSELQATSQDEIQDMNKMPAVVRCLSIAQIYLLSDIRNLTNFGTKKN